MTLVVIQFFDGLFTLIGVQRYGLEIEANPIMRESMSYFGSVPTMVFIKACCMLIIIHLVIISKQIHWIKTALNAVACIYMLLAILPWTLILSSS